MKRITLKCVHCGETRVFRADSIDALIEAIDVSGWRDLPSPMPSQSVFQPAYCPEGAP